MAAACDARLFCRYHHTGPSLTVLTRARPRRFLVCCAPGSTVSLAEGFRPGWISAGCDTRAVAGGNAVQARLSPSVQNVTNPRPSVNSQPFGFRKSGHVRTVPRPLSPAADRESTSGWTTLPPSDPELSSNVQMPASSDAARPFSVTPDCATGMSRTYSTPPAPPAIRLPFPGASGPNPVFPPGLQRG